MYCQLLLSTVQTAGSILITHFSSLGDLLENNSNTSWSDDWKTLPEELVWNLQPGECGLFMQAGLRAKMLIW
jgi:hypothetical protein